MQFPEEPKLPAQSEAIGVWGATEQKTDLSFTKAIQTVR
jgi:hypothetical protein